MKHARQSVGSLGGLDNKYLIGRLQNLFGYFILLHLHGLCCVCVVCVHVWARDNTCVCTCMCGCVLTHTLAASPPASAPAGSWLSFMSSASLKSSSSLLSCSSLADATCMNNQYNRHATEYMQQIVIYNFYYVRQCA